MVRASDSAKVLVVSMWKAVEGLEMTVRIRASFLRLSRVRCHEDAWQTRVHYSLGCKILGRYALHVDADGTISVG